MNKVIKLIMRRTTGRKTRVKKKLNVGRGVAALVESWEKNNGSFKVLTRKVYLGRA